MKIGILTLPLHTNYGGILQAWALQTVLERMGYEVTFIEGFRIPPVGLLYNIRNILTCVLLKFRLYKLVKMMNLEAYAVAINTNSFLSHYIHTKKYLPIANIADGVFDVIIVGGDQVLRPNYFGCQRMDSAFLTFTKGWNIKRIIYAASFGSDKWEYDTLMTEKCKKLIQYFDFVGIREIEGVEFCKSKLDYYNAELVLDPTMLLTTDFYNSACVNIVARTGPIQYVLDTNEHTSSMLQKINNLTGFTPRVINSKVENKKLPLKERIQPSVESWIASFRDADFVITDSYHACVFSILFNKPFIVIGNKERGLARFYTLLNTFNQEFRLVVNAEDINNLNMQGVLAPPNVQSAISNMREQSLSRINNFLNK